ncbi:hypothetical protein Tco_1390763, partial [Tanacetum coccineum]
MFTCILPRVDNASDDDDTQCWPTAARGGRTGRQTVEEVEELESKRGRGGGRI